MTQKSLLVWKVLPLDKQAAKRNHVPFLIAKPADTDHLEGDVTIDNEVSDRVDILLSDLENVFQQFEIGVIEH